MDLSSSILTPYVAAAAGGHHGPSYWGLLIYLIFTLVILFALMAIAKKDFGNRVFKNRWAQVFEQLYLFVENLCVGIIGPHGRKYVPMMMVFWMVIFVANCIALFFPTSPTADISFNLGIALVAIFYVQYEGIKANGFFGHFSHFAGPKLGGAMVLISAMIFLIELISEMMKNVSLTLRLYGNIDGGHRAVEAMNELGSGIFVPFGAFLLPIKVLTCVVQALIFILLNSVYISLVTHHDEEHGDHHGEEPHGEVAHAH